MPIHPDIHVRGGWAYRGGKSANTWTKNHTWHTCAYQEYLCLDQNFKNLNLI